MEPQEAGGEGGPATAEKKVRKIKRPNGLFVRRLERRKTDTIVDDNVAKADVNISTLVRRTQSDKTEYSTKGKPSRHGPAAPREPARSPGRPVSEQLSAGGRGETRRFQDSDIKTQNRERERNEP